MSEELTIVNVIVIGQSINNGAPISGEVSFSDGKKFGWSSHDNEIRFHTKRKMPGGYQRFSFNSQKRAKMLVDWLNEKDFVVKIINLS